ncbi:hypothetical protein TWF694_001609 [Orbilia ellipsospora]|uniref:MICOS complex subunit MIC12 n=1 Tax=Orbilia ellipsospora TaxID=2528407 RepID=A0AAV9X326_9PEZI
MGHLNGLVGGFVLTTSVVYLTTRQHQQHRKNSSLLLRESDNALKSILQPPTPPKPRISYMETRPTITETMKDSWNAEIESIVKWLQNTSPTKISNSIEDMTRSAFSGLRQLGQGSEGSGN